MNIPPGPHDRINHMKLTFRTNMPDEQVAAFLSQTPMIRCAAYRCLISEKECRARRERAARARRLTYHGYTGNSMAAGEYIRLSKCLTCGRTP